MITDMELMHVSEELQAKLSLEQFKNIRSIFTLLTSGTACCFSGTASTGRYLDVR